MTVEIRRATRKDLSEVATLLGYLDRDKQGGTAHASRVFREMARYPLYVPYLAHQNGITVGAFSLLVFASLLRSRGFDAVVDAVVVAPQWRGRGIGGAMMAEAMRIAAEAGSSRLTLSPGPFHERAERFYESLGFRQEGVSFGIDIVPRCDAGRAIRAALAATHH